MGLRTLSLLSLFFVSFSATAQISRSALAMNAVKAAHEVGNFDGVVVLAQNGKVVEAAGFGYSDRKAKTLNRPATVFRLASLTKQVTALLVMRQVEAGRFTLDQPAAAVGVPQVSVRQLLQHVSGLPNPSDGPENGVPEFYKRTAADMASLTKSAMSFCTGKAKRAAGGNFEYNNCDYIVLGEMLRATTEKTYEQLVRKGVIQPLELKS